MREAGQAGARPAPLRRADHGRRRAAPRLGRRDEDRRGQDARRRRCRRTSTRSPAAACTSSPSNDYLARRDAEWMGRIHRFLGLDGRHDRPRRLDARREARAVRLRHHLRHEQRVRLRLPPRQHGRQRRGPGAARQRDQLVAALLRDRRRGRLDPHRRGAHAAHHLGPGRPTRPSSTTSSPASCSGLQRDRDYEVDEAKRTVVPDRGGHRARRAGARRREPLRERPPELRAPAPAGAARARSCSSATSTTSSRTAR